MLAFYVPNTVTTHRSLDELQTYNKMFGIAIFATLSLYLASLLHHMIKDNVLIRKFKAPIYGHKVWIVVAKSMIKAVDIIEDMVDFKITYDSADLTCVYSFQGQIFILITPYLKPGAIAHEAKHVVNTIFHFNGVKLSLSNDEHECYYLDMMVDKVHNAIDFYKKKIIKKKSRKVLQNTQHQHTFDTSIQNEGLCLMRPTEDAKGCLMIPQAVEIK